MKRFSLILASLVLLLGTKASAFKGGPFDNGDYNSLLDNSGVYQVAFRFSNGSGFAQFGNNVNQELFLPTAGAGTTAAPSTTFSTLNRSIIYYKGLTYLGTCWGMVDHERRIVHGVTNGNSDIGTTQTTTGGTGTVSSSNTLIFNGVGFPANTEFECKIHTTHPVLKFAGRGELTIVNPSFTQTAFTALSNFVAGIAPATGAAADPLDVQINALIAGLQTLQGTGTDLIPSANNVSETSERVKMTVFGSRIFFVSSR